MSSDSAETFFDYGADHNPEDSGVIDSVGFENLVYLYPQDDQDQETETIPIDEADEEVYHLEVDSEVQALSKDSENAYKYKRLSAEQEKQLLVHAKMGDLQAQNKLVEANRWIVIYLAQRFQQPGIDLDELIQEGYIALWRAIEKKDIYNACRLSTYAHKVILWKMLQVVRKAQSDSEATEYGSDDTTLDDLVIDYKSEDALERIIPRLEIAQATAGLSDREKEALVRRFGLRDRLHVVGREIDPQITRTRDGYEMVAFRLVNNAIKKMRNHSQTPFVHEWIAAVDEKYPIPKSQ